MYDQSLVRCSAVLAIKERWLTAEAKFFLIRVLHLYGSSSVEDTVHTLETRIGFSDRVLKKVRDLLVEQGFLVKLSATSNPPLCN